MPVGPVLRRPRDDQRRARLVDQDRVHFVDDGEVVPALVHLFDRALHVVAKVVEAKLIVRSVGNVGSVSRLTLKVVHVVLNTTNFKTQEAMNLAHPLRVA